MKRFLNIILALILFVTLKLNTAAAEFAMAPNTGDIAIIISGVLIVIAVALFIFIRRRNR